MLDLLLLDLFLCFFVMAFLFRCYNFSIGSFLFCRLQLFLCLVTFFLRSCLLLLSFLNSVLRFCVFNFAVFVLCVFLTCHCLLLLYVGLLVLLFGLGFCKLGLLLGKRFLRHLGLFLSFFLSCF